MIRTRFNKDISSTIVVTSLKRQINQIYKLLPQREEGLEWQSSLNTVIEELVGLNSLWIDSPKLLFSLICKLEGLLSYTEEKDFAVQRKTIFNCLHLISRIIDHVEKE